MPKTVQKEEEKTAAVMQTEQESQKQTATPAIIAPQRPKGKPIQLKLENESLHPELMTYKNHQWEYAGESDENNPWKNDVFGKGNHWDNASVKKTNQNQYEITLSRKDGATFSFPARIVFTGKAYDEALKTYETWKENQNK